MGKKAETEELKRQNAIMRAALERYASRESWSMSHQSNGDIMPVLSSWAAEMYVEDSMAGHIAGGWGVAKAALEEVDGPMPEGSLGYCDVCGRSEVDNLISGKEGGLIQMTRHEEWCGLVVCEDCPDPEEGDE